MLSGIKTGKKRKQPPQSTTTAKAPLTRPAGRAATGSDAAILADGGAAAGRDSGNSTNNSNNNRSAAESLRLSLLHGGGGTDITKSRKNPDDYSRDRETSIHHLERRGRISSALEKSSSNKSGNKHNNDIDETVVIHSQNVSFDKNTKEPQPQHLRYNSKGKLSRHAHTELRQKTDHDITIEEMAHQERLATTTNSNMDEQYARNILRMGKGYNKYDKTSNANSKSGADEEDNLQETLNLSNLYRSNEDKLSKEQLIQREKSRQLAQHDVLNKFTSKSWWWMESSKFEKRYLIALGEKVSLVMVPSHLCLNPQEDDAPTIGGSGSGNGKQWKGNPCYLVPLPYTESFVSIDEEVWYEVVRFQNSLRQMYKQNGMGVLFLETVTRTSRGGGGALQAKMEIIPVPLSVERDAPLYFKSALAEVAQEWGTHGQKPIVLRDTDDGGDGRKRKTLRNAVPKGFPYFYVGWEGGGYVQLIEHDEGGGDDDDENVGGYGGGGRGGGGLGGGSKSFSREFGIDTVAGMMELDPIRFQRRHPARDGDRDKILEFCEKWKGFDWTLELDG